jgi:hypothetical protein
MIRATGRDGKSSRFAIQTCVVLLYAALRIRTLALVAGVPGSSALGRGRQAFASMKQISNGKQRQTENGARQIEVMTDAVLVAPAHPRKQVERFTDDDPHDLHPPLSRQHRLGPANLLIEGAPGLAG